MQSTIQSTIHTITVDNTQRIVVNNGEAVPYKPLNMTKPHEAFKAVVDVLNAHGADMFHVIIQVIANKYGHSFDEMLETITDSPEYINMKIHPLLQSLSYFQQDDVDKVLQSNTTNTSTTIHDDTDSLSTSIANIDINNNTNDINDTNNTTDNIPTKLVTKKRKPKTTTATTTIIPSTIPLAIPPPETVTIRKKTKKNTIPSEP